VKYIRERVVSLIQQEAFYFLSNCDPIREYSVTGKMWHILVGVRKWLSQVMIDSQNMGFRSSKIHLQCCRWLMCADHSGNYTHTHTHTHTHVRMDIRAHIHTFFSAP